LKFEYILTIALTIVTIETARLPSATRIAVTYSITLCSNEGFSLLSKIRLENFDLKLLNIDLIVEIIIKNLLVM